MSVNWKKEEGKNEGKLTFEITQEEINKGLDVAFKRVRKTLNVPGFRKGKIPRQLFNRMYGEEALYEDALNSVLPAAYEEALLKADVKSVGQPKINVLSMDKGKPWEIEATVTTEPEVVLGEYKDLSVFPQPTRVLNADIDEKLKDLQEKQAELVLKEDEPAKKGDTVVIDFLGKVDGEAFAGGEAKNHELVLGSNTFIPGFEDQLIGHKAGDKVDVKVTFPKDYNAKELAGKDAVFETTVHEVKSPELPKLDDEFAKDVDEEVDTLEELKAKLKEELKDQKVANAKVAIEQEAIELAVANATLSNEIPEAMIKADVDRKVQQQLASFQQQGIKPDLYFKLTNTTEEDLRKSFENGAADSVKTALVLDAIVKKEGLTATEEEINKEIATLASQYNMEEEKVRSLLSKEMLEHDIALRKAVELIASTAKQTRKEEKEDKD